MTFDPLAENVEELGKLFSPLEISRLVQERHPALSLPAYDLFIHTYTEMYGGSADNLCAQAKERIAADNRAFWSRQNIPVYYVRCLLPGCVLGPAA